VESGYKLICSVGAPVVAIIADCFWNRIPDLGSVSQKEGACALAEKPKERRSKRRRVGLRSIGQTFEELFKTSKVSNKEIFKTFEVN